MARRRALRRPSSNKKEYCAVDFDTSYDKKKSLEKTIKDEEAAIAHVTEAIATLKDEIAALIQSLHRAKLLQKQLSRETQSRMHMKKLVQQTQQPRKCSNMPRTY